jgi:hypothetical protein
MSHFYGMLRGSAKTEATRRGSKGGGLTACAASWAGAITVQLWHDEKAGQDCYRVYQALWYGAGVEGTLAEGIIGQQPPQQPRRLFHITLLDPRVQGKRKRLRATFAVMASSEPEALALLRKERPGEFAHNPKIIALEPAFHSTVILSKMLVEVAK